MPRDATASPGKCIQCTVTADCSGGVCAQFQAGVFCAPSCSSGPETCPSGTSCSSESDYAGNPVSVCVPDNHACGGSTGGTGKGSGTGESTATGSGRGSSKRAGSGSGSSRATIPATVSGNVGASGGSVSSLLFAIVGDTRPANEDDTAGYPTTIIDTIVSDVVQRSPPPLFVVSTGDYQFASTTGAESAQQLELYLAARKQFPGPWFPALGNHECTGATASNCGPGHADGITPNYANFMSTMLGPINQTNPYYVIKINAIDLSWTSKFVFVAANAWDSWQGSWLETTLAEATTYTFVIRHEPVDAKIAPGTTPSESIITQYPLTLEICGHAHQYWHSDNRVVIGNGGAPLTGPGDFGYGIVAQRSDGAIVVDEHDYLTNRADGHFHFVVTPTGALTQ